jgi:hypothetical protein
VLLMMLRTRERGNARTQDASKAAYHFLILVFRRWFLFAGSSSPLARARDENICCLTTNLAEAKRRYLKDAVSSIILYYWSLPS